MNTEKYPALEPGNRRIWSLWEMINASMSPIAPLVAELANICAITSRPTREIDHKISKEMTDKAKSILKVADLPAKEFELKGVADRAQHFRTALSAGITWRELGVQCRILNEALLDGLKGQLIYKYPAEKWVVFIAWQDNWKPVIEKFPSAKRDIYCAVDCWALGHGTASVYHLMRVLEGGLTAMAKDVGRDIGVSNWQNIIDQIESEIAKAQKGPTGIKKVERLKFLSEAAKEFSYFKDGWRNHVSHHRTDYDEHQARSVMEHVRTFMTVLSTKLSEVASPPEQA